jgi:hypothetical protein
MQILEGERKCLLDVVKQKGKKTKIKVPRFRSGTKKKWAENNDILETKRIVKSILA